MRGASIFRVCICIFLFCLPSAGKKPEPDYTQPYLILEVPLRRLEKEINRAGSHGYRVLDMAPVRLIAGSKPSIGKEIAVGILTGQSADSRHPAWGAAVLMEKSRGAPPTQTWQYRVSTACDAAGMRRAITKAAGYNLLIHAAIRVHRTFASLGDDCVLLLEHPSETVRHYEYQILAPQKSTESLNRAVAQTAAQGFETAFAIFPDHQGIGTVLEERVASGMQRTPGPGAKEGLPLECTWFTVQARMQAEQELNALGLKGFRLLDAEPPHKGTGWRFLMVKNPGESRSFKYEFVTAQQPSELGRKLNAASRDGYHLVRSQMTSFRRFQGKKKYSAVTVLLEKQQPGNPQFEYAVIATATARLAFLYSAVGRARKQKYGIVEFWRRADEYIVVAERQKEEAAK